MNKFPMLALLLVAYNVIVLAMPNLDLTTPLLTVPLISGALFSFDVSDLLLGLGIIALTIEIFKATRSSTSTVIDHILSMFIFVVFLVQFIVFRPTGTSTFLLLTMMALVDVIVGFSVTIAASRRDIAFGDGN
ncbi:MAG: hypothetical protein AAF708_21035 [Deinococcota bacterium]